MQGASGSGELIQTSGASSYTLPVLSSISIIAVVYPNPSYASNKQTFTSNSSTSGGMAYYEGTTSAAQGTDVSFVQNIDTATEDAPVGWQTVMRSCTQGGSPVCTYYRWGGGQSGQDTTQAGSGGWPSIGINQLFANYSTSEGMYAAIAEFIIINGTAITSTQASAIHSCMVSTYGVS